MEKAGSSMLTETSMMGTGKMTRPTAMESIVILMEPGTRVIGRKTNNMGRGLRRGLMVQAIEETMLKERSMEQGASPGPMGAHIQDSSLKITLKELASISGQMAESMMENGRTTKWKVMECSLGQTVGSMRGSTLMIRRKGTESSTGLMGGSTRESGKMGSSMEWASTPQPQEKPKRDSGAKARESPG